MLFGCLKINKNVKTKSSICHRIFIFKKETIFIESDVTSSDITFFNMLKLLLLYNFSTLYVQ